MREEHKIKLETVQDVIDFVDATSKIPGYGVIKSGVIEADVRSILGIMECNVADGATMVSTPEMFAAVKRFVVA